MSTRALVRDVAPKVDGDPAAALEDDVVDRERRELRAPERSGVADEKDRAITEPS